MILTNHALFRLLAAIASLTPLGALGETAEYDPSAIPAEPKPAWVDLKVEDESRDREIPLRVFLPPETETAPVVLVSHGLGGSREGSNYLGRHWAARGYAVVFLQHPGSDAEIWQEAPLLQRRAKLEQAAGVQNFMLRVQDVTATLDRLERWNEADGHELAGRLDLERVAMSGHSFGAVTTQAVSGQSFALGGKLTDDRIKAAIALSPSMPRRGDPAQAFGSVAIPWLLMTGTKDEAAIGGATVASRQQVYPALPPGGKYELVLDGAEHSAFTDRALPGDREPRNANHHRAILAISTAFWDAWLRGDAAARAWLDGAGPTSVLEKKDRWQKK